MTFGTGTGRRAGRMSDTERRHILKLQLAYLTALCFVALLAILGHAAVERLAGARAADGAVINLAGRQRMLSERLARSALQLTAVDGADSAARATLARTLEHLRDGQERLSVGDAVRGIPAPSDPELVARYAAQASRLHALADAARDLDAVATDGRALTALLDAQADFLASQEAIVNRHDALAAAKHAGERRLANWLFWITLATLALEALFVFEPAIRVMRGLLTRLTESNRKMAWQAEHDALTGLPNRRALTDELERLCHGDVDASFALLFLDFDGFKRINDSYGHEVGDALLTAITERLCSRAAEPDRVRLVPYRLGGDEFVVLAHGVADTAAAEAVGEALTSLFTAPHRLGGRDILSTASVGIVLADPERRNPATLLRDADAAMLRAKRDGKSRYTLFDGSMRLQATRAERLRLDVGEAIDEEVPSLRYQGLIDGNDGRVVGVEALLHWHHPSFGEIDNLEALDIARDAGRLQELGRLVLRRATTDWCELRAGDARFDDLDLHVNLSLDELLHPECADDVAAALDAAGMPPERLRLELSGGLPERGLDAFERAVRRLATLDVGLGFDNVGHQPMPLRAFTELPVSFIKLAPSDAAAVLGPFARFCSTLGYRTVATGIETESMLAVAREAGIDALQGWTLGRPTDLRAAASARIDLGVRPGALTRPARPRAPRAAPAAGRSARDGA